MSDRLTDEDVSWYAGESRTYYSTTPNTFAAARMLAREVQERRAADTRTTFTDDEMEAMRAAMKGMSFHMGLSVHNQRSWLKAYGLPDNLIAWVLGDPSPAPCETCGTTGGGGTIEDYNADPDAHAIWPPDVPCPSCGGEK